MIYLENSGMRKLIGYTPQNIGNISARQVICNPKSATLRENIYEALTNKEAAEHYIRNAENRIDEGNWTGTVVRYSLKNGEEDLMWHEVPPLYIIDKLNYYIDIKKCGKLVLPESGWVVAEKDGKLQGKDYWIAWDLRENCGFARKTCKERGEAELSFKRAGLDPRLVSYQWRRPAGNHGLVPVLRASYNDGSPLYIAAFWDLDEHNNIPFIGCLHVEGCDKKKIDYD